MCHHIICGYLDSTYLHQLLFLFSKTTAFKKMYIWFLQIPVLMNKIKSIMPPLATTMTMDVLLPEVHDTAFRILFIQDTILLSRQYSINWSDHSDVYFYCIFIHFTLNYTFCIQFHIKCTILIIVRGNI